MLEPGAARNAEPPAQPAAELTVKAREALTDALARILAGAATEATVADTLRGLALGRTDRRRVARTLFRASVLRLRLAHLAGCNEASALLEALARDDANLGQRPAWPTDPAKRLAIERSAPPWLVAQLKAALGHAGADAFLSVSNLPGPKTLRVNALRATRAQLAQLLAADGITTRPGALSPWSLIVEERDDDDAPRANLSASGAWRAGLCEIQDESSQCCVVACDARPGEVVVDLCAGRGGKALALAASMADRGALWLNDIDENALTHARARLARAGVTCARRGLPAPGSADLVLVDAPCSSLGPLRRSPDLRYQLTPAALGAYPDVQRALLAQGASLLRPGGRLVYATCTILRAENEGVTQSSGLQVVHERTLLPHLHGCDGFYFAVLRAERGS